MRCLLEFSRRKDVRPSSLMAIVAVGLLAGACSSTNGPSPLDGLLGSDTSQTANASSPSASKSEMDKALDYWGAEYKKQPHDLKTALSYARNLKAAGHKDQAFSVLQGAALLHGDSKELASEYGRLALEFDQVGIAEKLLAAAEDPLKPDWKITSARGTALAKQGNYAEAIPVFERALVMSPQPSVMNNLAMAHAATGDAAKAETILRQAAAKSDDPKIKQNLALVVGLQGKHDESRSLAAASLPAEAALADADYIRKMVKSPAVAAPKAVPAVATRSVQPGAKVIQVKSHGKATDDALRPGSGPSAVGSATSAWSTTVSKAP